MKAKQGFVTEAELRKRARKKLSARREVAQHAITYAIVNLLVWIIYFATWTGFPWPLFVTFGWGIGFVSHLADYYFKHGKGAENREAEIEQEVANQRRLARERGEMLGDDEYDEDDEARVYDLSHVEAGHIRLSDDGELVEMDGWREEEHAEKQGVKSVP